MEIPKWLEWAQEINALAQSGLAYTQNVFDQERYEKLREISAEMISTYTQQEYPIIRDILQSQTGYATPKIDIRGVVFREEKILLVKELADGLWTLPGGWVDINEPPSLAVEREVREESGYEVKAKKILAVFDRNQHGHPPYIFHSYKIYVLCELLGGSPMNSIETGGAEFFARTEIPPLSTPRTTLEVLERMFAHLDNPTLATDFD